MKTLRCRSNSSRYPLDPSVVPGISLLASRLGQPAEAHNGGTAQVVGIANQDAQESMVLAASLDSYLIEASHIAVHCLPLTATSESRRRCLRNCGEHRMNLSGDLGRQPVKELDRWYRFPRIVSWSALKEVNQPRIARGPGSHGYASPLSSVASESSSSFRDADNASSFVTTSPMAPKTFAGKASSDRTSRLISPPVIGHDWRIVGDDKPDGAGSLTRVVCVDLDTSPSVTIGRSSNRPPSSSCSSSSGSRRTRLP